MALSLATPAPAYAGFSCDITGDDSYQMDTPGTNGESIMPAVMQWDRNAKSGKSLLKNHKTTLTEQVRDGTVSGAVKMPDPADQYTLYELNGMRGLNWSMTFKGRGDAKEDNGEWGSGADECSVMDYVNNGIADSIFNGTKILTRSAISIKESASNPSPLSGLYEGRDNVVKTLRENVLRPAIPVMIALTGLWVFTKWRKGDMREVWAGVAWASLTIVAVMAFTVGGNYDKVVRTADSGIAEANSLLAEAVLSGVSGKMQPPCDLPDNVLESEDTDAKDSKKKKAKKKEAERKETYNRGLRVSSCAMYDTLAFRPWALGQFGDAGKDCIIDDTTVCAAQNPGEVCKWGKGARCEDLRVRQAVAQSKTNKDAFSDDDLNNKFNDWTKIRKEVANDDHGDFLKEWSGQSAGNRVGIAFYSIVAALIVGLMVIVLSIMTLLWHAVTLILVILLPLVATLGIHPSQQKLLKGWLETFIHSFVLRAGFGVILTVLLVLYQMILPAQIALGMQLLLLLLVTVAVVMMLKKLLSGNFSAKIAGAEDSLGIREMGEMGSNKLIDKAQRAPASAAQAGGRVVGTAASVTGSVTKRVGTGTTRFADRKLLGGKLARGGWIDQTNRQKRKGAYGLTHPEQQPPPGQGGPPGQPDPQQPQPEPVPASRRRVSGSSGQQPPQPVVPTQPQGRPPTPQPVPGQQPALAPQPPPQQQPPPPAPPRPNGRVSE
ncbi:hypothetical protein [Streptomyces sp. H27-D2]|uniref:hypothetical protein n=1 Tax=Streptomyces sp. H27-D2 TaxID=3046304 RepID=UPI002DB96B83|nr:hypothetical protein [Streptomyces sp. H27-D2]MEC4018246.1 hypothetical protein [Streptomyces sp. H27-D2]